MYVYNVCMYVHMYKIKLMYVYDVFMYTIFVYV